MSKMHLLIIATLFSIISHILHDLKSYYNDLPSLTSNLMPIDNLGHNFRGHFEPLVH